MTWWRWDIKLETFTSYHFCPPKLIIEPLTKNDIKPIQMIAKVKLQCMQNEM